MAFTYILRCSDDSYYTGVTNDINRRMVEHMKGEGGFYTSRRLPVELVWCSEDVEITVAIICEKQIKGWRREKKKALIRGDYKLLSRLARGYGRKCNSADA